MRNSIILKTISRILLPFMLLFGIYIISYGDISPGGGFQGGAILASAYLAFYFIEIQRTSELKKMILIEKILFLSMIFLGVLSFFTKGVFFTNPIIAGIIIPKRIFMVILNLIIAGKVTIGLISIIESFIEEEADGF